MVVTKNEKFPRHVPGVYGKRAFLHYQGHILGAASICDGILLGQVVELHSFKSIDDLKARRSLSHDYVSLKGRHQA